MMYDTGQEYEAMTYREYTIWSSLIWFLHERTSWFCEPCRYGAGCPQHGTAVNTQKKGTP